MIARRRRLKIIQIIFLIFGLLIIFFTYLDKKRFTKEKILSKDSEQKILKELEKNSTGGDVFYEIRYTGLDLSGNRYILKSEEAYTDEKNLVKMKKVEASFFFKDDTILYVWSDNGEYNNATLDMTFYNNVKAIYELSKLFSDRAEYSNSKSLLTVENNVKIEDVEGTMFADKLLFDIKKQELNITSFNDKKVNANLNLE